MKIERINENKIKVLIDDAEAREWNITNKKICENSPEAQQMFLRAIHMAKSIDFSVDGAKLFVETIPSLTDGVGVLITRVNNDSELAAAVNNCSYKGRIRRSELNPPARLSKQRKYIYCFDDFDTVCTAAKIVCNRYQGISTLYKLDEKYYLYLIPAEAIFLCETDIVLSEFAERVPHGQYIHGKLNEYGTVMIQNNAVNILSIYF